MAARMSNSGLEFFVAAGQQQRGPFAVDRLLTEGVSAQTLVWREGMPSWQPAGTVSELAHIFVRPANAPPVPPMAMPVGYAGPAYGFAQSPVPTDVPSKKILAGLMGIFFGAWGVHRFVLGDVGGGFLRIVITFCTCGIGGFIGLIEGIIYLTKTDEEFYRMYMIEQRSWF